LRGKRLSGAARSREEGADAEPPRAASSEPPLEIDPSALPHVRGDGAKDLPLSFRQHEVVPGGRADQPRRQLIQSWTSLCSTAFPEAGLDFRILFVQHTTTRYQDRLIGKIELGDDLSKLAVQTAGMITQSFTPEVVLL